jgi:cytochrome c-type biogenesis protein CcmF
VAEGERFALASREGALVFNNVMLSAILAIVLLGTLYPLLTEAFDVRVSVGPPYFNPVGAIFVVPMLLVMAVGPLLRWRQDSFGRLNREIGLIAALTLAALILISIVGEVALLPLLGLALAGAVAVGSLLPLRGRNLRRVPIATWGMVVAHFGIAVALFGMACDSAFTKERLAALAPGQATEVGPWRVVLADVEPVAGANWTALQADLQASYNGGTPVQLRPETRTFWAPSQATTESELATRWNGQLYAVIGEEADQGRWQIRLWWKPFVTMIWFGGMIVALGGVLALVGRLSTDLKRRSVTRRLALRRRDERALVAEPAE